MSAVRGPGVRTSASAEEFFRQLELGALPVPVEPALVVDAYDAYRAWCFSRAERPSPSNDFVVTLSRNLGVHHVTPRLAIDNAGFEERSARPAQRRVLLFGARPLQALRERRWIVRGTCAFRRALREWQRRLQAGDGYDRHPQQAAAPSAS